MRTNIPGLARLCLNSGFPSLILTLARYYLSHEGADNSLDIDRKKRKKMTTLFDLVSDINALT